ncbi:MAG: Fe-S cluster assembly protein SufD [Alphaproteobacteria bacterium]|jgi:Fe-S cluster assembly protein SufD
MAKPELAQSLLVDRFEQGIATLPGPRLAGARRAAMDAFAQSGFPTPRIESWKYTNLNRISRADFDPLLGGDAADIAQWQALRVAGAYCIAIVNGRYSEALSDVAGLPDGVRLTALSDALGTLDDESLGDVDYAEAGSLVALNTAFMRDGLVLEIAGGIKLDRPVQVLHVVDAGDAGISVHPRTMVAAGPGAEAVVVETFAGNDAAAYWTNSVTDIDVGANASVRHYKRQAESIGAFHTALTRVSLARDARYAAAAIATGAVLSRNETRVSFDGEGADCEISGGALLRGRQHADSTTRVEHRVPHTSSRQVFRNVLDENAHSVFQGGVIVRKDAQKTDSSQSNRNLLLSAGAQADTKPELQIFADDVKCAHGATVGDLDRNAMFYLTSRGVPPAEARALLIEAFVGEVTESVPEGAVRDHVVAVISDWMAGATREDGK